MEKLEIKGGRKISGTIVISGSKNATIPILASTILTNKKIIITNAPILRDVETMVGLLSTIGSTIKLNKKEKKLLKKVRPWGIILFSRNIINLEQLKKLIKILENLVILKKKKKQKKKQKRKRKKQKELTKKN